MVSFLFNPPSGIPGEVTRPDESNVEPAFLVAPLATAVAQAMKNAAGGITPFAAGDSAAVVCGFLVRAVPAISGSSVNESFGSLTPNPDEVQGMMIRGYANVKVNAGTPVRGQPVGIVQTASMGHPAGAFEAATTGNNIPLSATIVGNWTWASDGVDAEGNAEIRIAQ